MCPFLESYATMFISRLFAATLLFSFDRKTEVVVRADDVTETCARVLITNYVTWLWHTALITLSWIFSNLVPRAFSLTILKSGDDMGFSSDEGITIEPRS